MARQLIIELVGDAAKLVKSLDTAGTATKGFGDKVDGAGRKMSTFVSVPIVGFLAASTKAAMDDAAAQTHLATTLRNTVGDSKSLVTQVEGYITAAQKASTFTDDELRPAFETLVTATNDVEKANHLLGISMDVAAGKGIPLETAALAVTKASEGQFTAVNRLVPGLIDVGDKSMTAEKAVALLAATFNGQAIGATETTAGKMQTLKRDLGETSEKIGTAFLPALGTMAGFMTDTLLPTLDKVSGGNGALVLLGVAAAGPVLTNVGKLVTGIQGLNLSLDATAVKAAAALGAVGIVVAGVNQVKRDLEGGWAQGLLGSSPVSRFLDRTFHDGGVVPGPRGSNQLIMAAGGETILPTHKTGAGGGGGNVTVIVQGSVIAERDLGRVVADALRNNRLVGVT